MTAGALGGGESIEVLVGAVKNSADDELHDKSVWAQVHLHLGHVMEESGEALRTVIRRE